MTRCSECKADVSDRATLCPRCGAPTRSKKAEPTRARLLVLVIGLVIGVLIFIDGLARSAEQASRLVP